MILQAKWMLRRPLQKKPAHCKSTAEEPYLDDSISGTVIQKGFDTLLKVFYFRSSLTKDAFFSQSVSGLYGGRRELSVSIDPSVPSDQDRERRRAQHHGCRAAAGLHDHSMISSSL